MVEKLNVYFGAYFVYFVFIMYFVLSPNDHDKNGKIIYKCFKGKWYKRNKKIDERRGYLLDERKHNDLMSENHEKVCMTLNYFENFIVFFYAVSGCVSISEFVSLIGVPLDITNSAVGLKVCAITAGIEKYKSIVKKKKEKHNKIVLLGKTKLKAFEILVFKFLINS